MSSECWGPVDICSDCCTEEVTGSLSPERWQAIQDWAVDYLWRATGKRFGLCEETYRPCRRNCDASSGLPHPFRVNGQWVNIGCNKCVGDCGCATVSEVILPNVHEVTGVRIDGVDYDPETVVAVYDRRRLVRIDGEEWPGCQNLGQTDGVGTWSITVLQGHPVPAGGAIAAGLLACEFAKACLGSDKCRLPKRIQTVTRQGVTVGFQDQFEGLADLRTGIWEIDAFIESARAVGWQAPSITSPDRPDPAVLTWPVLP